MTGEIETEFPPIPETETDQRDRALRVAFRALMQVVSKGSYNMIDVSSALGTVAEALKIEIIWEKPVPKKQEKAAPTIGAVKPKSSSIFKIFNKQK